MGDRSAIEWTDATWNPIVGCSIVSPGCTNCYAMKWAHSGMKPVKHYDGTTKVVNGHAVWTGKINQAPEHILTAPLSWKKPRRIFVNSMGDLFHEDVPDAWIDQVFAVMALCPQHTFQVLTKRAKRMRKYLSITKQAADWRVHLSVAAKYSFGRYIDEMFPWPLPNVWLGVSCEDQTRAEERIPDLLATPAAIRFVSAEPLLNTIDFKSSLRPTCDRCPPWETPCVHKCEHVSRIDWVIAGGESGPGARPMHPDWARSIRDQCTAAGTAFFFKQWGEWLAGEANRGQFAAHPMNAYRRCDDHGYAWPTKTALVQNFGCHPDKFSGDFTTRRVGKKRAGRLLDGIEHNGYPARVAPKPEA